MECINGALLMCHEHLAGALGEQRQIAKTSSGADRIFHRPPEAFHGVEGVPTVGWEHTQLKLSLVMLQCRVELVRPMDTTAVDDHHPLFAGVAKDGHDLRDIVLECLCIKIGRDFREEAQRAVLDSPHDTEQDPGGATAPGAILLPTLAFAHVFAFDLAGAERMGGSR